MHRISISSWHCNGHIIPAFVIHHIHALHLHKLVCYHTYAFSLLFCSDNCIHSIFIVCTSCSLMHGTCIFLCKIRGVGGKKRKKTTTKENKKSCTTFLVTCVGYHDGGCKPNMLGLYANFFLFLKRVKITGNLMHG